MRHAGKIGVNRFATDIFAQCHAGGQLPHPPAGKPDDNQAPFRGQAAQRGLERVATDRVQNDIDPSAARDVADAGGGRTSLTRAAASLGSINLGHFLPDYTAYEELPDDVSSAVTGRFVISPSAARRLFATSRSAISASCAACGHANTTPVGQSIVLYCYHQFATQKGKETQIMT